MTDSNSFSSLFALVDSHLSKCKLQESSSTENGLTPAIPIPSLNSIQRGRSDTRLTSPGQTSRIPNLSFGDRMSPGQRFPIPNLGLSESPITSVLSEQLSNMFKAKELKKQQELEREKLHEEMRKLKLEEKHCVIDLMKAVQTPNQLKPKQCEEVLSSSSSFESLLLDSSEFIIGSPKTESELKVQQKPLLPCKTDMSYIINEKIKTARCSAFGKVLTSRLRPVAAPYLREKITSDLVRFDFSTKSPCDLIKEKLKKPALYNANSATIDIFNQIMASSDYC